MRLNGYEYRKDLAAFANEAARLHSERGAAALAEISVTDLRACLFYEWRRWRHLGEDPEGSALDYGRSLIEAIRVAT